MSAFWDDFAVELANDEVVTYFIDACERIANRQMGLVPCEGRHGAEVKLVIDGRPEAFMLPYGRCPSCGAQL